MCQPMSPARSMEPGNTQRPAPRTSPDFIARMHLELWSEGKTLLRRSAAQRLAGILIGLSVCCAAHLFAADGRWVTTWGCGPQLTEPGNLPPATLDHSTLRQFVHTTLGGKMIRVRFSNAYG